MEAFIVKTFPCNLNGDGFTTTLLKEGDVADIPDTLIEGLEEEGYITIGEDVPTVQSTDEEKKDDDKIVEEVITPTVEKKKEEPKKKKAVKKATKKSAVVTAYEQQVEQYVSMGKEGMLELLEDSDVELKGKESDLELAELCVAAESSE